MNETIEEVQELSQRTLAINRRGKAKSENFRHEERKRNDQPFSTLRVLKNVITSPWRLLFGSKNKNVENKIVENSLSRECFKLVRIQKIKINNESLFELRYIQYFTPQQLMPLFYGDKNRMQARVQLIDAKDHNGIRLPNNKAFTLLKIALRMQK